MFTKEITIAPAYDKRNKNPDKDCGVHGCEMRFILKGELGVVQFVLFTNWQLPHVTQEFLDMPMINTTDMDIKIRYLPSPADLGYHSPVPIYEGQEPMNKPCEYLDGKPCYYDGSGLNAETIYKVLLEKGSDGVWKELEIYYHDTFDEIEAKNNADKVITIF